MMSWVPERRRSLELIDLPEGYSRPEFAGNLADIRLVNRFLGAYRVVLTNISALLRGMTSSAESPVRMLDVATGSSDIPVAIVKWARQQGIAVAITAVDKNHLAVSVAADIARPYPEIVVMEADGFSLPYKDASFDIVLCSQTLHHFNEADAVKILREINRVAAFGYFIMDRRRSRFAWLLISALTRIFSRNRLTRHDGPMSMLRSYTVAELSALSDKAGLTNREIVRKPFWLMVLSGKKV